MKKSLIVILMSILSGFSINKAEDCCPELCDSVSFELGVDYLFWQALQDQLSFGLFDPNGFPESFIFSRQIFSLNQKFKGISGVRVRGGAYFCDDWDAFFGWTHLNKCSTSRAPNITNGVMPTPLFGIINQSAANGATSRWCLKFDTFDVEMARTWCPYESFDVRSHIGIKAARITQEQSLAYFGVPTLSSTTVEKNNKVSLVGPRAGFDAIWSICNCINVVGGVSGSLLFGKIATDSQFFISTDDISVSPLFTNHTNRLRPVLQMMLGLGWDREICNVDLELGIAYEAQYWWGLWQTVSSIAFAVNPGLSNGDFMTHGLTVHAGIKF